MLNGENGFKGVLEVVGQILDEYLRVIEENKMEPVVMVQDVGIWLSLIEKQEQIELFEFLRELKKKVKDLFLLKIVGMNLLKKKNM